VLSGPSNSRGRPNERVQRVEKATSGEVTRSSRLTEQQFWALADIRRVLGRPSASRVRKHSAPVIFSTLRNSVLNVLQTLAVTNRAAQLRSFCADPVKALNTIRRKITEN